MRWKASTVTFLGLAVTVSTLYYCVRALMQGSRTKVKLIDRSLELITRDPKRKLVYSYRTDDNVYISNATIDVGQEMVPDLAELDSRTIIVSGFGQQNALDGLGMIASAQAHMPNKKIIIYNLGIHPKTVKNMKAMCNVEVRRFQYSNYPSHVQQHENRTWKLLVVMDLLKEYGAVFFATTRIRFRAPINLLLPFVQEHHGIIGKVNRENRTVDVTHPSVYRLFGLRLENFAKAFPNAPILSEDALLLVNNSEIYTTMLQPLRTCALKIKCIAPVGSTKHAVKPVGRTHTHSYEMSAFTLLMYRNFRDTWLHDTYVENLMGRIHQVSDTHVNDHMWAHFCNPPKKEVNCISNGDRC